MKTVLFSAIIMTLFVSLQNVAAESVTKSEKNWWGDPYPTQFDSSQLSTKLDFVSVQGNKLIDESGKQVIFRGVNIADPDKLLREGKWSEKLFKEVKAWGLTLFVYPSIQYLGKVMVKNSTLS
jgi:endoglucanase